MIDQFRAFFTLFQQGKELSGKDVWRNRAHLINSLTVLLTAGLVVAKGFGYNFNVDSDTINGIAVGIASFVSLFNSVVHAMPYVGITSNTGGDGSGSN